uniref:Uncharacterized protein n=1 Tax=Myoviridae sp. ct0jJ30 TaxID=2825014 RepID=A0A8S5PK24_9CAUD|nr:MAG TPA: hypothetical protein [Myoviridae sp. ct0jJ30]
MVIVNTNSMIQRMPITDSQQLLIRVHRKRLGLKALQLQMVRHILLIAYNLEKSLFSIRIRQ